mgnify:CR=1 FL=1
MKNEPLHMNDFEHISREKAASLKGGRNEEDEYIIIYINGVPYRIKRDKKGQQISEPEKMY